MEEGAQPSGASTPGKAPLSDAEVVERVRAGETPLFEVLMRRYNQRIYRCVRSILRNEADTERRERRKRASQRTELREE